MSPRKRISVFLDPAHLDGLKALKAQTMATEAAHLRKALEEYLERHGVASKTERKRVAPRKRS